ncbi:hypothetical protein [Streptomyces sp. NPDC047453]|uniref:hypothetical protein n=1 Tax=Streptomyces sp. NPDC047453 TaxID=3154812 RepID=UPI0034090F09
MQASTGVSEAARQPNLKVERVAAYIKGGIEGKVVDTVDEAVLEEGKFDGPHIDVTFDNRAPGPSLVTKATVHVRESGFLPSCHQIGGNLVVSMNYDFPIPAKPLKDYEKSKEISFTVKDNDLDRLTVTIGPDGDLIVPWYGLVDVSFQHDGKKTTVGPIAVVDVGTDPKFRPDGDSWIIKDVVDPYCLSESSSLVDRLMGTPGVTVSKELKSLRDKLTSMGH